MARATDTADKAVDETSRVAQQLAARLESRGVTIHTQDSADELGTLTEAVENFEAAVESRGGDLMMDEPPSGQPAQPDNADFVLPERGAHESAHSFVSRVDAATARLRA